MRAHRWLLSAPLARGPLALGLLGLLGSLGCAHSPAPPVSGEAPSHPACTGEAVAGREALVGTALAAKGRALLRLDDAREVALTGLDAWPDGVDGLSVRACGHLVQEARLPRAVRAADGAWSQGVAANSAPELWLDAPVWALVGVDDAPWALTLADGNGNVTEVSAQGPADGVWRYLPVTPEQSSSGMYSGGAPAQGALRPAQAVALWQAVTRSERDVDAHEAGVGAPPGRPKGSFAVSITSPAGQRSFTLKPVVSGANASRSDGARALDAAVRALRTPAAQPTP